MDGTMIIEVVTFDIPEAMARDEVLASPPDLPQ
jgi:hypothetical protein